MSDFSKGSEIHKEFLKLIIPFLLPGEDFLIDDASWSAHEDEEMEGTVLDSQNESENDLDGDFEFYMENGTYSSGFRIQMDEPVPILKPDQPIKVLVSWSEKMIQDYDTSILSLLPEVCKTAFTSKWTQDSMSLYKCVGAFLKEEPLGPDDMWYLSIYMPCHFIIFLFFITLLQCTIDQFYICLLASVFPFSIN